MSAIKETYQDEIDRGQRAAIADRRDYPMIFDTRMVKAILYGEKTETRRLFKKSLLKKIESSQRIWLDGNHWIAQLKNGKLYSFNCPFGEPGDLIWVKETLLASNTISYKANFPQYVLIRNKKNLSWKASIHMKKTDARLWLYIKEISVQRIQSITEKEAMQEGTGPGKVLNFNDITEPTFREGFCKKWISIYGIESWHENPWVWVIKFIKHPLNNK